MAAGPGGGARGVRTSRPTDQVPAGRLTDQVPAGRLTDQVPAAGEDFHELATLAGARVEHIVSSAAPDPGVQVQDWDEWVLVLSGAARLEVAGHPVALAARDWLLLPAGTAHRVLATEPGTQWLAVHASAAAPTRAQPTIAADRPVPGLAHAPVAAATPSSDPAASSHSAPGADPAEGPAAPDGAASAGPAPGRARSVPASPTPWPGSWPDDGETIADVVTRLVAVSEDLPVGDGVRAFTDMYLETTRQVADALARVEFADQAFLDRLDVNFAHLYLAALAAHRRNPKAAPRCWTALIAARARPGVSPLQCALVGMNAHITYDLPQALVRTAVEFGRGLDDPAWRADFLEVNAVLARTQPIVKQALVRGLLDQVDDALGTMDDRLSLWAIEQAREGAWLSARAISALGGSPGARRYVDGLDRMVALTSRALLAL
jgi:mannose-6-phosphate isomerase-like protein (cupin superfamily)